MLILRGRNKLEYDLIYFFGQDLFDYVPESEIESEVYLFHAVTASDLRASIKVAGIEF